MLLGLCVLCICYKYVSNNIEHMRTLHCIRFREIDVADGTDMEEHCATKEIFFLLLANGKSRYSIDEVV